MINMHKSHEVSPLSVRPAKHLSGLTVGSRLHNWTVRLEIPCVSVHLKLKPVRPCWCDGYENLTAPINPRFITSLPRSRTYFSLTLTRDWLHSPTKRVCCVQTKTKVSINQRKFNWALILCGRCGRECKRRRVGNSVDFRRVFPPHFHALSNTKLGRLVLIKNASVTAPWCKIINAITLMEPSVPFEWI